eukprot:15366614-Ditylum_brightwellii.AAC.1
MKDPCVHRPFKFFFNSLTSFQIYNKREKPRLNSASNRTKKLLALQATVRLLSTSSKYKIKFNKRVDCLLEFSSLPNDEMNAFHPLALVAYTQANPNILSHNEAMKAPSRDEFLQTIEEEIIRMIKNDIFEVVPRSKVPHYQKVLRAVWSHRRKIKSAEEIYRHRSRLCADDNKEQHGIDYNEMYSPVVQWST